MAGGNAFRSELIVRGDAGRKIVFFFLEIFVFLFLLVLSFLVSQPSIK